MSERYFAYFDQWQIICIRHFLLWGENDVGRQLPAFDATTCANNRRKRFNNGAKV